VLARVLIFIGEGVEDSEFIYPFYRFQEAGYEVDVVGSKANETYPSKHGIEFKSDLSPKMVNIADYEAFIVPGGRAPDKMRTDEELVALLQKANTKGKVIAAICHGPQMMIEANLLRGKRVTCWKSVMTDVKNAGATYVDQPVVVDGNLVTSRKPADLPQFCRETLRIIQR
jgi:protease I